MRRAAPRVHPERMPEQRLQRTRATLPSGYQFGDCCEREWCEDCGVSHAHGDRCGYRIFVILRTTLMPWPALMPWRAPHENAAEQLARAAYLTDRDCGDEA